MYQHWQYRAFVAYWGFNHPAMSKFPRVIILFVLLLLPAGGAWWYFGRKAGGDTAAGYQTATVKRGEIAAQITANGTVEPEELVDVGAQVAGQISAFGTDGEGKPVDYGSVVKDGQMLATIDDALYAADVASARAALAQAQAGVTRAEADVAVAESKLTQAGRDWERAQKLGPSDALAATTFDAYKAGYDTAVATLAVAKASLVQAKANVDQTRTGLTRTERNLSYCVIKSPVSGVVIDRRVNIGQTVVASLNAPSLFLIAKDLKRMQVWVAVNEADIGQIKPGMPVSFTVDAFPDAKFRGSVGKVRLNATMTQNVVTYTVEVETDNTSGQLLPYLTANVRFETGRNDNALLVPNAALRWKPATAAASPGTGPPGKGKPTGGRSGTVYLLDGTTPRPLSVTTGLTDGLMTEVEGDGLAEGAVVITGEIRPETAAPAATTNPFAPTMPRGGRRGM